MRSKECILELEGGSGHEEVLVTWSLHSHIHNHSHQEGLSSSPLTKQHLASVKESIRYNVNEH